MKIENLGFLFFCFPIVLLSFALFTAYITDFKSVIGLLLCIAAIFSSLERTTYEYKRGNWLFVVLGIILAIVSALCSLFYHGIMTWDYGPFYFPVSE
tara:strand:+ start:319 stop:609 length:291 start_codon:yes stop_codon:yes gene_type:complete